MKNRKLLLIVSLVLAMTMSLGGTLAYLTDTDSDVNVMTLGNVKVEQFEMERVFDEEGNVTGMQEFTQGQPLYPIYTTKGAEVWAPNPDVDIYYGNYIEGAVGGNGTWQDMTGELDKFVFVKNTGDSDLYYRTWIACEADTTGMVNEYNQSLIHLNINGHANFQWDKDVGQIEIEDVLYNVMVATHKVALKPGEISRPSLLQVAMDNVATNEFVAQFGGTYEILTFTQAVQTTNMPDAVTALNAAFGKITEEVDGKTVINHPWTKDNGFTASTADEVNAILAGLAEGEDVTIALTADVDLTKMDLTNTNGGDVTIMANGHKITSDEMSSARAIHLDGSDRQITIVDAKISTKQIASDTDSRVIAFNPTSNNMTVNLIGCDIDMASNNWAFAVNITGGVQNVKLNIEDCTITGAIPVNIWGDNNTITIKNSTLNTNYDHPEWAFSASIVKLNNDGTTVAENNTVIISNCHFGFVGENNNGDNDIYAISDGGTNNTITLSGCTYDEGVTPGVTK